MATLPYGDPNHADVRDLIGNIIAQRGSVLHLYQMLLHSPPIAEGWLGLLTAVRQKALLPGGLRELVIMRVAILNGAPYEAQQHAPIALAEGVTSAQLDQLSKWSTSNAYDPAQRAVLSLTDSITRNVKPGRGEIDSVRQYLNDREVVELVVTISAYNMVSRFLEALGIDSNDVP